MNVLSRLLGQKPPSSRETAKQRLQFVLVHDRNDISPGMLELLKDEIIAVISRHIDIDKSGKIRLSRKEALEPEGKKKAEQRSS